MRGVIQRVTRARVVVAGEVRGEIGAGIMLLAGFARDDSKREMEWLLDKVVSLRIFEDQNGKMNLSLLDTGGELLIVPQFTLQGDCRKGRRPSFSSAAPPNKAEEMFNQLLTIAERLPIRVASGVFQAEMEVELVNHGPVTILVDSKKEF